MLALIYLGLAIALGDLLCRRFYRFVSTPHRCAAGTLVGILFSTWFTYLAGLILRQTGEPLLLADLLFFVVALGTIFWVSRNSVKGFASRGLEAPKVDMIASRTPGSSRWDWITLGALFAAACVLFFGTLYVNKQSQLRVLQGGDLVTQLSIAQTFALGQNFPTKVWETLAPLVNSQFLFYFQAGNLEFLGLNLAWSVDVLSVLSLTSMLALVMALGELLFHSCVVGRLGATFFFFHGFLERLTILFGSRYPYHNQSLGFWNQIAFVNQRYLAFATGIFLLVLIFLIDQYLGRSSATRSESQGDVSLLESKDATDEHRLQTSSRPHVIRSAHPELTSATGFVFSGLLVVATPLWNVPVFIASAVLLCCLLVAYGCWRLLRLKTPAMLGPALGGLLTTCILSAGAMDLLAVHSNSHMEVKHEDEPLVKGLVFRRSALYKIPGSLSPNLTRKDALKLPVAAFEGGNGNERGQSKNPRGIASDGAGNIFVADTGNSRIEKFSPDGILLSTIGTKGSGSGQLADPNGIAVDRSGNIYIADAGTHRVLKVKSDGTLIVELKAPEPGFYGPRKIAIGPDDSIYVVDQGHARIVKFDPDGKSLASWGGAGSGDGQFKDPSSVAVDPTNNQVYVADPINSRIQVFDSNGKFLTKWSVPEWGRSPGFEDLVIDPVRERLYASSANMDSVLAFDLNGTRVENLMPPSPDKLEGPSGLALFGSKLYVLCFSSGRVVPINL